MPEEATQETKPAKVGMLGKLIAGGVIGIVVLIESVVAYMLTPNPDKIAEQVRAEIVTASNEGKEDQDLLDDTEVGPVDEIELGQFDVAIHDASADATYHVSCKVVATVAEKDQDEFKELLANNENRLRERIMIEFRSASPKDLNEDGLGLIKRHILEKSNSLIGKPLIRKIIFPEYNYYVQ